MIFLLALTKIQDVDAWLHLSSGRLLWLLGDPRGVAGQTIEELGRSCRELRILGSYPEGLSRSGA